MRLVLVVLVVILVYIAVEDIFDITVYFRIACLLKMTNYSRATAFSFYG